MSLNAQQVQEKMKENNVVVLDVLDPNSFHKRHIPGSQNMFYVNEPQLFVDSVEQRFGRNKFFITYCDNAGNSAGAIAANALKQNSFQAENYPGGMDEWEASGLPVEGTLSSRAAKK